MKPKIIIAGAGGIGKAVALLLIHQKDFDCEIIFGDISPDAIENSIDFVNKGLDSNISIQSFIMPEEGSSEEMDTAFEDSEVVLDCLPGSQAPRIAMMAKKHFLHYANLTEYVNETEKVREIAHDADTAFVLQTGLAPGFINVLACRLFEEFTEHNKVEVADKLKMKVGALSKHAKSPHYYNFTWSPIGVATEYLRDAYIVRDFEKIQVSALSGRGRIIIDGDEYEDNFTSGGAADLPEAFSGRVADLDYKTIRYPGHYHWVETALSTIPHEVDKIKYLERMMLQNIASVEDDVVIIYASVEGNDYKGRLRRTEKSYRIHPVKIGHQKLRAIQSTTASSICEIARMMLKYQWKGTVLQSQVPTLDFLNGPFVRFIYGEYEL